METALPQNDLSFDFYLKYLSLTNNEVILSLKNKRLVKGKLIGFFKGSLGNGYIERWHLANVTSFVGVDGFACLEGEFIKQLDITQVTFLEDGSSISFEESL